MRAQMLWPALLIAAGAVGSFALACVTPFAAVAAIAASTLGLRAALGVSAATWLANQAIGYGVLNYPLTADSLGWGLALGLAALGATAAAAVAIRRNATGDSVVRHAIGFCAALVVNQAMLLLASLALGGSEGFTAEIVAGVAALNAAWMVGFLLAHRLFARNVAADAPAVARGEAGART